MTDLQKQAMLRNQIAICDEQIKRTNMRLHNLSVDRQKMVDELRKLRVTPIQVGS